MHKTKFYRLGIWIYHYRWMIIALWIGTVLACLPLLPNIITPFKTTGFVDERSESAKAEQLMNQKLGFNHHNKFLIMYHSKTLLATSSLYKKKVKKSLKNLDNFPIDLEIIYPESNKNQISKDKHTSYVVIIVKSKDPINTKLLSQFKSSIKTPSNMTVYLGGEPLFVESVNKQTQTDLYRADFIATPLAVIVLILVFGSLTAALIPIILGGGCALIVLTTLYFLGHLFTLSIFTLNIALLLGLCLSLDYSLFIIYRFRDELDKNTDVIQAIALTQANAGKAIFFGGLAVFASLSALLIFPVNILFSVAIGGLTAVFIAGLTAIIILPAILAVLKNNINALPITLKRKNKKNRSSRWHWLAEHIVKRPHAPFIIILIFLLSLGYPFLSAQFGVSDFHILPEDSQHRDFYDVYTEQFNINELSPIVLLIQSKPSPIRSPKNIARLYDLAQELQDNSLIKRVISIVTTNSNLNKEQYYQLYQQQKSRNNPSIKQLLDTSTRQYLTIMNIISKYSNNSPQTDALIKQIRETPLGYGMTMQLTGTPVINRDVMNTISQLLPYAFLWIMVLTYLILLVLLRSLFLPLKALLMNILSLSACYGALVLVFQDGYLHQLLNFQPQGMLDISLLVIIFCALFGFSIDYEVFLLSRIKEAYDETGNNEKSIIFGIEKSSRIITSAALIVIVICISFLVAEVLMVKAFGLGIAVAVFVDAFLIRTALVPATMALFKSWNWYLPKWLNKILPKL
ncbi:MMPL family transporter [Legionella worsleiensis]|uniref:Membrane protein YdfJ n=1 Tax=Legionella worsleiensis TaxID=45076 RepID=A0A0W1AH43_9GAMM|nr:MMPL family transporter [Legionella worsleiensis]KTD80677.1 Membrane protein YdfJ [Legionella worsleiensis]STY32745.1 Membrane transport protein mmpL8 [Legionella worsleiensis]